MGHRHLYGLAELHRAGWKNLELVAVCDPVQANAESLADQAARFFDRDPVVVNQLSDLAAVGVEAVDVTTTPRYHHLVALETMERGWHTMTEKPLGLTVAACNLIRQGAKKSDRVFSVAENYRRDPINRLAKALLAAGVIGQPRLLMQQSIGGGNQMIISVWRHQKDQSGLLLDVGVHYTDMMEYLLGDIVSVYAQTRLHEPVRTNPAATGQESKSNPAGVYGRWQKEMPAEFQATAEDAAYATLLFKNGAVGQYIEDHAGQGQGLWSRRIYGSTGSMELPGDRQGQPISLHLAERGLISDERILDLVPDFKLDPVTAALFGGERLWRYELPFAEIDRKLIAVEYAEFAAAIAGERSIEVGPDHATRSVAIAYAMLESGLLGRPVTIDEVLAEQVDGYQREINEGLGL
jgi:predicted dehydrogenase